MTDVVLFGLSVLLCVACYAYWTEHAKAVKAQAGERQAWAVANAERDRADAAEADAKTWLQRTLDARCEMYGLALQHDNLQALYCDLVRRTLAANSWIVFQNRGKVSE
jgi:hypothetical protein